MPKRKPSPPLCELLRAARIAAELSQAQLASAITPPITQASVACMESRGKPVSEATLVKVADALGTTVVDLLVTGLQAHRRQARAAKRGAA